MNHNKNTTIAFFGLKGLPAQGGTAAVGENIIRQLNREYRITVYATSTHATQKEPIPGVRQFIVNALPSRKLNIFYYNLVSALHALFVGHYQLVHTHQIDIAFIIPLLRLRYKVVATHHGKTYEVDKWSRTMRRYFKWSERLMLRCANQVTFVADTEREDLQQQIPGNYLYIPNGINRPIETEITVRKEYLLFAAGRVIPHKGCHIFLEALRRIGYSGQILIAGEYQTIPAYRNQLLGYADTLNIEFLGMIRQKEVLQKLVSEARLFIFPSFYEAMSMMMLEVAAQKTPMICSDIRENKAVFNHQEVLFFETGNADDLASKISEALANLQEAAERAEKAYQKLITHYCWDTIALQYREVYEGLMD